MISLPGGRGNDFVRGFYGYSSEQENSGIGRTRVRLREPSWHPKATRSRERRRQDLSQHGERGLRGPGVVENAQPSARPSGRSRALVYQVEGVIAMASGGDVSVNVKVDGGFGLHGPVLRRLRGKRASATAAGSTGPCAQKTLRF